MTTFAFVALALLIGAGSAVQAGMISSLGRLRGAPEAAWISVVSAVVALGVLFAVGALRASPPNLPAPFKSSAILWLVALLSASALAISVRGVNPVLATTGLFGFAYLVGAGFLGPRIGIALFASSVTAGTLIGSVVLDHWGAFGADVHRLGLARLVGVLLLVFGVLFVHFGE